LSWLADFAIGVFNADGLTDIAVSSHLVRRTDPFVSVLMNTTAKH
jgi:hypothetical protein